jgi:ketosteroid isomerase-like protein
MVSKVQQQIANRLRQVFNPSRQISLRRAIMKTHKSFLPLLILSLAAAAAIGSGSVLAQSVKASETRTGKELRALYEQLLRASERKDEKTLRRILANDYMQVTADGRIRSKQDRISETLSPKEQSVKLSLDDFRLRIYADAAIALCKVRQEGTTAGKPYQANILSTVTFIRQGGRWRIAATHLTFAKE